MKVASEGVEGTEPEGERWRERERERAVRFEAGGYLHGGLYYIMNFTESKATPLNQMDR